MCVSIIRFHLIVKKKIGEGTVTVTFDFHNVTNQNFFLSAKFVLINSLRVQLKVL